MKTKTEGFHLHCWHWNGVLSAGNERLAWTDEIPWLGRFGYSLYKGIAGLSMHKCLETALGYNNMSCLSG